MTTTMGPGVEFDAIRRMIERWGSAAEGIGDDAAIVSVPEGSSLVVSTDVSIEGVHFKREWLTASEIGYRAAAAALSDIAAMGARPVGMLLTLTLPERWRDSLDALVDGIGVASRELGAPVLGGDMSRGAELSLGVTVVGSVVKPLRRSGARAGDAVYVTGRLGGSGEALRALQQGTTPASSYRERLAHPVPRIREAEWLSRHGATAAIDISDGLGADLRHVAAASGVRIVVDAASIPCMAGVSPMAAAASGEEYEIVVTSREQVDVAAFEADAGIPLTRIGKVEPGEASVEFVVEGQTVEAPVGYLHFQ